MIARDAEIRRLAARILVAQAASTIVIAAVYFAFQGKVHGLSALVGGLIGLTANAWMTLMTLRATPSAAGALGRLVFGQMVKVMLTVGLLLVVARGAWANWPALLIAYAATLLVFWFVPVLSTRPRRAKD